MTYAMSLNNVGFAELTLDEMLSVDGGDWRQFGFALMGSLCVTGGIVVAVVNPIAGAIIFGTGIYCFGNL